MTQEQDICDVVRDWHRCDIVNGAHLITTLVQMPSGSILNVHIRRHQGRWVVSDGGAAIEEAAAAGIDKAAISLNIRRAIRQRGLKFQNGQLVSPPVDVESLQSAVIAVANTSNHIAETLVYVGLPNEVVSIDARAHKLIAGRFPSWVFNMPLLVKGHSEKQHKFDTGVLLPDGRKVLIDAVNHHANSINSVVVANLDVKRLEDQKIIQRIVFDASEPWKAEEISLLQVGATPVALSNVVQSIEKLAA